MKIITYSLRAGGTAAEYYRSAASCADVVLEEGLKMTLPVISDFRKYIIDEGLEEPCADEEYMLELLTLGVLWLRYSDDAIVLNKASKDVLTRLVELRQKGGSLKPGADFLRGILGTFVLYSEHRPELVEGCRFTVRNFENLISWLSATGEFVQEVKRFKNWLQYLQYAGEEKAEDAIAVAVSFAIWFEEISLQYLGKHTEGVETFLQQVGESHKWKEDLIFCGRQRLEYHLNMAGAVPPALRE